MERWQNSSGICPRIAFLARIRVRRLPSWFKPDGISPVSAFQSRAMYSAEGGHQYKGDEFLIVLIQANDFTWAGTLTQLRQCNNVRGNGTSEIVSL